MIFGSDNMAPVHPAAMAAITQANSGYTTSYGTEDAMKQVTAQIRDLFEAPQAAVYLVATGTAANALALAVYTQPCQSVFCHELAHVHMDECGAPEFYTGGAKLVTLTGENARITPETLHQKAAAYNGRDVHQVQFGCLSLTNVTETGAVYTPAEITALTAAARQYGMATYLDGARLANAIVAAGCTPAEMTWKAGIDVVSFGGTKNGLMGVEAVILFDPEKAWEFELRRKRAGHLFSKHRFLAAQMQAYLQDDLWRQLATRANAAGAELQQALATVDGFTLLHRRDANLMFAAWPRAGHERAKAAGAYYYDTAEPAGTTGAPTDITGARLVCNWNTTSGEIARFAALVKG
jgi:threonine aldolase